MFVFAGNQSAVLRTFMLDYIERSISDHPERPVNIVIRKSKSDKLKSYFGYIRPLAGNRLKRIVFKYLDSIERIVSFLLGIMEERIEYRIESIVIEDLHEYIGNNIIQASPKLVILFNVFEKVKKILVSNNKIYGNIGVTIFGDQKFFSTFRNYFLKMQRGDFIEIKNEGSQQYSLLKNNEKYQSPQSIDFFNLLAAFNNSLAQ